MRLRRTTGLLLLAGAVAGGLPAAPAGADPGNVTDVISTLDGLGIAGVDPSDAAALGRSLCPLLAERGQNTADIAAGVSDALGSPIGAAGPVAGVAISLLCPAAVDRLTQGAPLLPLLPLLG